MVAPILNLSTLNGSNGFRINGIATGDFSGSGVSSAGDVNGDGIDDLIIGANSADPNGTSSGQSYVVFGSRSGFAADFIPSALNGSNGFRINGIAANDYSGNSVSSAGDVNGDGIDDLIIGADGADPNGTSSGQSYVVFGSRSGFAADLNLSTLNGSNGFRINGIAANDYSGNSVSSAGDVNGDGVDDLIIGANSADPNGTSSGQSYVVFGRRSGFSTALDLSTLNGSNGFRINGIAAGDSLGFSVNGAGDVNGDSIDDLIIGADGADPNGTSSGQSYVVFGRRSGFAADLNLSTLNGSNGFRINGIAANDFSGFSVSGAGDVNGDGIDDLIIGADGADPNATYSGQSYLVFGRSSGFAADFIPSALNGSNGFRINGIAANDFSGNSVSSAGDVNGDGVDDLIIGADGADPNGTSSGQSYVVFGRRSGFVADLNLSTLNGSNGFIIDGITAGDRSGRSVSSAGDVNGDGVDDLIIGAAFADLNGINSGQSYVVFGVADPIAGLTLTAPTVDASGLTLGSVNADLNAGTLILNFTPRAVSRSIAGFTNVLGTALNDSITGSNVANTLTGNGGNDAIVGNAGNDVISGGAGNDSLQGGADDDLYLFDANTALGSDSLSDAIGVNTIDFSTTTTQSINLNLGLTTAQTVNGNLSLTLGSAGDITNATGGGGGDQITGNALNNSLVGNGGNDSISGGAGNDNLQGGVDNDLYLFAADTALGSDSLNDAIGVNTIDFSATTTQSITLNLGLTTAQTVNSNLSLTLGSAADITNLTGGNGGDRLTGNALSNALVGNGGNDSISGGVGNDSLSGGSGRDHFVFSLATRFNRTQIGVDAIADFTRRQDKLVLDRGTFRGVRNISFATVNNVRQAQGSAAQFTYIRRTGALYFNTNGAQRGFGGGGQFADLANGLNLTATDIVLGRA